MLQKHSQLGIAENRTGSSQLMSGSEAISYLGMVCLFPWGQIHLFTVGTCVTESRVFPFVSSLFRFYKHQLQQLF